MWDEKVINTITDVMVAVKQMFPAVQPQLLIDYRLAILNYQHHPVFTMAQGLTVCSTAEQRPYEPVAPEDMDFLQNHHSAFCATVKRVSYDNNTSTYSHNGCPQHEGACGGEYKIVDKCPKDSTKWTPFQFMTGKVPILHHYKIVQFLGQGTIIHTSYCTLNYFNIVLLYVFNLLLDGTGDNVLKNAMGRGEERAQSALVDNTLQLHIPEDGIDGRFVMYFKAVVNQSQGIKRPLLCIPLVIQLHMQHMRLSICVWRGQAYALTYVLIID